MVGLVTRRSVVRVSIRKASTVKIGKMGLRSADGPKRKRLSPRVVRRRARLALVAVFGAAITVSGASPIYASGPELVANYNISGPGVELEVYPTESDDKSDVVHLLFRSDVVSQAAAGKDIVVTLTAPHGVEPCFPGSFAAIQQPDRSWGPIKEQLECDSDKIVLTIPGDSESNGLAIGNHVLIFADNTVTDPQAKSFATAATFEDAGSIKARYATSVAGSEAYKKNGQRVEVVNREMGTNQKVVPGRDWLMQTVKSGGAGNTGNDQVFFTAWLNGLTTASAPTGKPAFFMYYAPPKTEIDCDKFTVELPEAPGKTFGFHDLPDSACDKTYLRIPFSSAPLAGYGSPLKVVISGVANSIDSQAWDFSSRAYLLDPAKGSTEFTTYTGIPTTTPSSSSTTAQASPTTSGPSLSAKSVALVRTSSDSSGRTVAVVLAVLLGLAAAGAAARWRLLQRKS